MKKGILAIMVLAFALTSCTENERAKQFGGTATVNLPQGQKLVNVTWKEDEIWYLTRSMNSTDTAETYTFQEESSYGMMEGTVILKESK
jgi:uncharacterized lipoprotein YehR (DUF1307 family)